MKVGYQDGTVFGGLLTIIAATLVILYAISRVNRADARTEMIDSLAAVGGLAYLIVVAFDGVWQLLGKPFRDLDLAISFDKLKDGRN